MPEHPRARGENNTSIKLAANCTGTSPRTRGKRGGGGADFLGARNIPAHAGKTVPHAPAPGAAPEHPRARGENSKLAAITFKVTGTSPRTRGKHRLRLMEYRKARNIPAHAGKTDKPEITQRFIGEHPRARGENFMGRGMVSYRSGNIPAHAGKTLRNLSVGESLPEHPRARGENKAAKGG